MKRLWALVLLVVVVSGWLAWPDARLPALSAGGDREADVPAAGPAVAASPLPAHSVSPARQSAPASEPVSLEQGLLQVCVRDGTPGSVRRGAALEGALVRIGPPRLTPAAGVATARGHTDPDGRCRLSVPPGARELRVEAAGFLPFVQELAPPATSVELLVALTARGPSIRGRLLGPDGQPVPGAVVVLDERPARTRFPRGRSQARAPTYTLSDGTGHFELPVPANRDGLTLVACVDAPGLAPLVRYEALSTEPGVVQTLRIPRALEVDVRVTHPDGRPAEGRIEVHDGRLHYDVASDPLLSRVPGLCEALAPRSTPGRISLRLPPGGYTVLHEPSDRGAPTAFFGRVAAEGARELSFVLDG